MARKYNILNKIFIIIISIFVLLFLIIEGLIICNARKNDKNKKVDYILVLGARLYGSTPSPSLKERLDKALEYGKLHKDIRVVVCGGQGEDEDITEAEAMKLYLVSNGIDENRIILEEKSTTTYDNIKFAREIIQKNDSRKNINILLVTSNYHIFRSKFLAKRLGFIPFGLPAKTPKTVFIQSYIREYFAIIKSFFIDRN
ncbi:YdcF family protein [Anaerosalibacter bizertensis]|uniref:YdcF family protein n=1 Tax=Anaerosalibacter bizertensis TaxID=932217 RepID=UPI00351553F6